MSKCKYGYKPDRLDGRDKMFQVPAKVKIASVNLADKHKMPPIFDQKELGACVSHAISSVFSYCVLNKHIVVPGEDPELPFSRLFIYYNGRLLENSVYSDSGLEVRDGIKAVVDLGVCSEPLYPYNTRLYTNKPSPRAYAEALNFKAVSYERVDNSNKAALIHALQSGHPIIFGMGIYESFESDEVASTGVVPMPDFSSESLLGGHCVYIYRYKLSSDRFYCVNSYGEDWGEKGHFSIPADYITNTSLCSDFWIIKNISEAVK